MCMERACAGMRTGDSRIIEICRREFFKKAGAGMMKMQERELCRSASLILHSQSSQQGHSNFFCRRLSLESHSLAFFQEVFPMNLQKQLPFNVFGKAIVIFVADTMQSDERCPLPN